MHVSIPNETSTLTVVRPSQTKVSERVKRLQAEARTLARQHVGELVSMLGEIQAISAEIAQGGEAYPAGVRDIARRLAEDAATKAETITAISRRAAA